MSSDKKYQERVAAQIARTEELKRAQEDNPVTPTIVKDLQTQSDNLRGNQSGGQGGGNNSGGKKS
jgi:hypothetical protein